MFIGSSSLNNMVVFQWATPDPGDCFGDTANSNPNINNW
jgi:hypothetical protein